MASDSEDGQLKVAIQILGVKSFEKFWEGLPFFVSFHLFSTFCRNFSQTQSFPFGNPSSGSF